MRRTLPLIAFALTVQAAAKPASDNVARKSAGSSMSRITPAVPIGDPASWLTNDDYPAEAVRNSNTGTVNFTLAVDETGKVSDCSVTESSGNQTLDDATCALMMARARFTPAHDEKGRPVPQAFHRKVRWQIPTEHEIWTLDQISFPAPKDAKLLAPLAGDHSMDAVVLRLKSLGIAFKRGPVQVDILTLPEAVIAQVAKVPATEPFAIPQADMMTVSVITARTTVGPGVTALIPLPPPGSTQVVASYDIGPDGKPSNCAVRGEVAAPMVAVGALCKAMAATKPSYLPDPAKQGRHVTVTVQLLVTPIESAPASTK